MKLQRAVLGLVVVAGLAGCSDAAPTEPEMTPQYAANQNASIVQNVVGTITGGTFTGTAQITQLAFDNGQLVATGVLNGVATVGGVATNIVDQAFTTAVSLTSSGSGGACQILFLDLGPIFLDLLGLQVDLSQVILDITAVPGAGNLLGNLLCAVVNLLNNPLGNLTSLLNLLALINGLLG